MTARSLLFAFLIALFSLESTATHVIGGQVHVRKIDSVRYAVDIEILHEASLFPGPYPLFSTTYNLIGLNLGTRIQLGSFQASLTNFDSVGWPPYCGSTTFPFWVYNSQLSDTITIPQSANGYSDGILFEVYGPMFGLPFPDSVQVYAHIRDLNSIGFGKQEFPKWSLLKALMLCRNQANSVDMSASESDGDSLIYEFFDPEAAQANSSPIIPGTTGYFNQISSNPPIVIDPQTGILNGKPINQGVHSMGQKVLEYRNGNLIYESYRSFRVVAMNCPYVNTAKPRAFYGDDAFVNSILDSDTVIASSGNVEIPVSIIDPDSNNVLRYEVQSQKILPGDISLVYDSTVSNAAGDTMTNRIIINLSTGVSSDTLLFISNNINCYADYRDTFYIPIVFANPSNAGLSNTLFINIDTATDFDMFPYLNGNPIQGGTWIDVSNSGLITSNGAFWGSLVTQSATYKARYEQQNMGYPIDTATLTIRLIKGTGLTSGATQELRVFPNPSSRYVQIESTEKWIESVELIDIAGQKMPVDLERNETTMRINTLELENGIYILKMIDSLGDFQTERITILH